MRNINGNFYRVEKFFKMLYIIKFTIIFFVHTDMLLNDRSMWKRITKYCFHDKSFKFLIYAIKSLNIKNFN